MTSTLPRQTRAMRRAEDNASPSVKRSKMRIWVAVLSRILGAKNGANDSAVRMNLAKYEPYTRANNPETKGIDTAYKALKAYYLAVFEDVALYVSENNNQEAQVNNGRI